MIFRFLFESIVGFICLVSILLFGSQGAASLALFALLPIIMRIRKTKPDERELQLFYKTGNLTMGLMILAIYLVHHFSDTTVNGQSVGANWMTLSMTSILFIHGITGIIVFKRP